VVSIWYNSLNDAIQHLIYSLLVGSAKEDHVNRNRGIVGLMILAVLIILVTVVSVNLFNSWSSRRGHVNQRTPLLGLGYCSTKQITPCILSFNLDSQGNMLINLQTESSSPPNFYLKVRRAEGESLYECQRMKGFSNSVACIGKALPPGEVLQFLMLSTDEDILIAEGNFPIIGLAIATPEIVLTPTPRTPLTPEQIFP